MSERVTTDATAETTTDDVTVPVRTGTPESEGSVTGTRSGHASIDGSVERDRSGRRWRAFAAVGVVSLVAAVVVATVPGVVGPLVSTETTAALRAAIPVAAVAVALVGLYGIVSRDHTHERSEAPPIERPKATPESAQGVTQVVGTDVDDALEYIDGRVDPYDGLDASYAADVRRQLRETVRRTLVRRTGLSPGDARAAVEQGTWTEDVRAASFVGGDGVPDPPLALQLRDWASGEGFDRNVAATLDEIRRLRGGPDA